MVPGIVPDGMSLMVRRAAPLGAPVVAESTPVVAFGDPALAKVATLGINPSRVEFMVHGELFADDQRRLATLRSLRAHDLTTLTDAQVAEVISDCSAYFHRNPYRAWFDPLDEVLRAATRTSYYDGTACHLDLVQWATDPAWGAIHDKAVRNDLLEDGIPHLREQLRHTNIELVLLNGRQVLTQVKRARLASLTHCGEISMGTVGCQVLQSKEEARHWIGWSTNLQSSFGVPKRFSSALADRLATLIGD